MRKFMENLAFLKNVGGEEVRTHGAVPASLPRGRGALPPEVVQASQRKRLLNAMAHVAGTKGIVNLTVADLVRHAGVGRKSFYELYSDKTECYVEAFTLNAEALLVHTARALREEDPAEALLAGMRAYLARLSEFPIHAQAFLLEARRIGVEAVEPLERIHAGFVSLFFRQYVRARAEYPELEEVSERMVIALIGGITELVCLELARAGAEADITGLEPDVIRLTTRVFGLEGVIEAKEAAA